jgi:Uma2 family endonuclease
MAMAQAGPLTPPLTFEEYLAEGEISRQYDIVDGRRVYMPGPTRGHQRISKNLTGLLLRFEHASGVGQMYYAPMDVLIRPVPLQTRQPDLLLISNERLARAAITDDTVFLTVAPELVVEILSASDRGKAIADKLDDYDKIGVGECWIVRPEGQTVEVRARDPRGHVNIAVYGQGQEVQSVIFPDLRVAVADVFAE